MGDSNERTEILEGYRDYMEEKKQGFDGIEEEPEVTRSESFKNLQEGLAFATDIIEQTQGRVIGTINEVSFYDYSSSKISLFDEGEKVEIIREKAESDCFDNNTRFLRDDELIEEGEKGGSGSNMVLHIGGEAIACSQVYYQEDGKSRYRFTIGEKPVIAEHMDVFREKLATILEEKVSKRDREIPLELLLLLEHCKMDYLLSIAVHVGENEKFDLGGIFGTPYFGSYPGGGQVGVFDLESWKNHSKVPRKAILGIKDNGFVVGPTNAILEKGTILITAKDYYDKSTGTRKTYKVYVRD